ncbi:MinD/ParA family protein [Actinoplanes sp. ATCC 53533]|uniref:MinD/ParA family ATP-binding protein n=1 Tax=Actinoplanes sp. ATCC 53533 TaxID=1288362 RepID=UPI003514CECA
MSRNGAVSGSGPARFPTVTPRKSPENVDEQHSGAVYRPGPVGPNSPRPGDPQQAGQQSGALSQAAAHQSGSASVPVPPHVAIPNQPGPQHPAPPPGPNQHGPNQHGPNQPGPNQPGPNQHGPMLPGPSQPGPSQAGPPPPGPTPPRPNPPGPIPPKPNQAGPNQAGPNQAGPNQAGPVPPFPGPTPPHQGQPHQGQPHQGQPHQGQHAQWPVEQQPWMTNGQPPPAPGPFPPTIDPRTAAPHPQLQQPHQGEQPPGPNQPPPVDPYQQLPWVSDGTPTAEEFARRRLAKPAEPTATMGARAMLQKGTMGLVRLAPGKREQEYKQDVEMVRRNFGGLRQVTVVNPKGGAGKTVAVLLLAMTFGQKRGGYVLAWDNNETQGTLGMRAQQDFHARTVRDMMRDLHLFRGSHGRVGDLSQYVRAQGEGMFDVLASDESATAGEMLTASAFAEIREIVSRFYKLIFVDTGNNVRAQNWQAAMDATDQLVITMSARNDSAETAARMLDHLEQSGRQRLVRQAVSVVTMPPTRKDIDLPAIQRHFAARTRAVLLAPYEKLIDSGEPLRYGHLSAGTRDSWLKIAAAVAEGL